MTSTNTRDATNDEGDSLTQADVQARRLLDIVLTLLGSPHPVSSTRLRELHYPDVRPGSFRKLFLRDRERLALCGIVVRRTNRPPDEPLWEIDQERSFVAKDALTPREAMIIDVACAQLAGDPSFPLASDLRIALAKVDRLFDKRSPVTSGLPPARSDRRLATLEGCLLSRHAVDIGYRKADGTATTRRLLPYGLFSLGGQSYLVAPSLDEVGSVGPASIRTYRVDRITSIRECKDINYVIPKDFDVHDYVLLPFQTGRHRYYADFVLADGDMGEYALENGLKAYVIHQDGFDALHLGVADEDTAASWAIEQGLVPLQPPSLVATWNSILRSSLAAAEE